ncbi:hypothetical protein Tco_1484628 [Tanacetum coccineum]
MSGTQDKNPPPPTWPAMDPKRACPWAFGPVARKPAKTADHTKGMCWLFEEGTGRVICCIDTHPTKDNLYSKGKSTRIQEYMNIELDGLGNIRLYHYSYGNKQMLPLNRDLLVQQLGSNYNGVQLGYKEDIFNANPENKAVSKSEIDTIKIIKSNYYLTGTEWYLTFSRYEAFFGTRLHPQQLIDRIQCPVYHTLNMNQFIHECKIRFHIKAFDNETVLDMEFNHTRSRSHIVIYAAHNVDEHPIVETESSILWSGSFEEVEDVAVKVTRKHQGYSEYCAETLAENLLYLPDDVDTWTGLVRGITQGLVDIHNKGVYQFNDDEMDLQYDCHVDIDNLSPMLAEVKSMLFRLRNPIIHQRPSLDEVLNHYWLYGCSKRLEYIRDAGDVIKRLPLLRQKQIDQLYTFNRPGTWSQFFTTVEVNGATCYEWKLMEQHVMLNFIVQRPISNRLGKLNKKSCSAKRAIRIDRNTNNAVLDANSTVIAAAICKYNGDFSDHNFITKIEVSVIMTNEESVKDMTSKFDKLAKFEGQDFRRWQKKMHFLLTTLKVVYVLSTPSPVWSENETLEATRKRMKWENEDYIRRGHILNGMSDSLFDIYQTLNCTKHYGSHLNPNTRQKMLLQKMFVVEYYELQMIDTRRVFELYQ